MAFLKFIFPYIYSSWENTELSLKLKSTKNYFSRESQRKLPRLMNIDESGQSMLLFPAKEYNKFSKIYSFQNFILIENKSKAVLIRLHLQYRSNCLQKQETATLIVMYTARETIFIFYKLYLFQKENILYSTICYSDIFHNSLREIIVSSQEVTDTLGISVACT